jgi:uncharacterized membrane-anchored protein
VAELKVPANYSFTEASGARAFLEGMRTSVPKGLVGILQPNSGGWWVTFEYADPGFVRDAEKDQLDAAAILKNLSSQNGRPGAVTWDIRPFYDAAQHAVEWAVRTEGGSATVTKHTVRLLGRHGYLDAVVTQSGRDAAGPQHGSSGSSLDGGQDSSGLSQLKELVKGVSFKEGQGYGEHKEGDQVAAFGLIGSISRTLATTSNDSGKAEASGGIRAFWIGLVVIMCVGTGTGIVLVRKLSRRGAMRPGVQTSAPMAAPMPAALPAVNGSRSRHAYKAKPLVKTANHNNTNGRGRRKVFNYQKFYTEMVLQGPTPVIGAELNGYEIDLSRLASQTFQVEAPKAVDPGTVLGVNSELIANQKTIIEEQKRLIQEQARLIAEKTQMIAEKNQLLQRQSDLIDNNLV